MYLYLWTPQGIDMIACSSTHFSVLQYVSLTSSHLLGWSFVSVSPLYVDLHSKMQLQYCSCKQRVITLVASVSIRNPSCVMAQTTNAVDYQALWQFINTMLSYCIPLGTADRFSSLNSWPTLLPILHSGEGKAKREATRSHSQSVKHWHFVTPVGDS